MTAPLPGDVELLAAAHDAARWLVRAARWECGYELPRIGPAWPTAPRIMRAATLALLGEAMLHITGMDAEVAADLRSVRAKEAAEAIAEAHDWTEQARPSLLRPTHVDLQRLRARPGPLARQIDPAAVARWVATGSSGKESAA